MSTLRRRLLPIAFAVVALAPTVPGATAATIKAYPIQSLGDHGADVLAIHGFLVAHGYPVAIDGTIL